MFFTKILVEKRKFLQENSTYCDFESFLCHGLPFYSISTKHQRAVHLVRFSEKNGGVFYFFFLYSLYLAESELFRSV